MQQEIIEELILRKDISQPETGDLKLDPEMLIEEEVYAEQMTSQTPSRQSRIEP